MRSGSGRLVIVPVAIAALLAPVGTVADQAVAATTATSGPTRHVDRDRRGDVTHVNPRALKNHPRRRGEADFVRTTYAVRHHGLDITYLMGTVRPTSRRVTVQISSGLALDGAELDLASSYGGGHGSGTTVFLDRSVTCRHRHLPLVVEPRRHRILVHVPAACLPGRVVEGAYDDSYVFGPGRNGNLGQDLSRASWRLRLR